MSRLRLVTFLTLTSVLSACGQSQATQGRSVLEDCKSGRRAGPTCQNAQAAEAHRTHREAQEAFRNMSEGR